MAYDEITFYDHENDCLQYDDLYGRVIATRISSWRKGLELFRWCGGWVPAYDNPQDIIFNQYKSNLRSEAEYYFADLIPQEIQDVAVFYQFGQLTVLKILRYWPAAYDLAVNSPILFLLLAESYFLTDLFNEIDLDPLLRLKRKDILCRLGYAGSKSMLNFSGKIELDCCGEEDFLFIKKILSSPLLLRKFRHFPSITRVHLTAAGKFPALLQYSFFRKALLRDAVDLPSLASMFEVYKDTIRLGRELEKKRIHRRIVGFELFEQLHNLHDRWVAEYNRYRNETTSYDRLLRRHGEKFPTPPVPGNDTIIPVKTLSELILEGRTMHHCVTIYAKEIYKGTSYIYKVLEPERATLEIDTCRQKPTLLQLKLACNKEPDYNTYQTVQKWLATSHMRE